MATYSPKSPRKYAANTRASLIILREFARSKLGIKNPDIPAIDTTTTTAGDKKFALTADWPIINPPIIETLCPHCFRHSKPCF